MPTFISSAGTSSPTSTTSISTTIPAANVGDVLVVVAAAERTELPTLTIDGSTSNYTTFTSPTSTNLSYVIAWKRIASGDVGDTIAMTNTTTRRQALGYMLVRDSGDPIYTGNAPASTSSSANSTAPNVTPASADALLAGVFAMATHVSPFQRTWTSPAGWTERGEFSSANTTSSNATVYFTTKALTGGAGVSQTGVTITADNSASYTSGPGTIVFPIAVTPPGITSNDRLRFIIDKTGTPSNAGAISYSISQTSGPTTTPTSISAGKWEVVPSSSATLVYTVTVSEAGGSSATSTATVNPTTGSGSDGEGEVVVLSGGIWS